MKVEIDFTNYECQIHLKGIDCKAIGYDNNIITIDPWLKILDQEPDDDCEILFVARDGLTEERIGITSKTSRLIFLRHAEISYDDVLYWMKIPELPK
jgi:hypothetical protein